MIEEIERGWWLSSYRPNNGQINERTRKEEESRTFDRIVPSCQLSRQLIFLHISGRIVSNVVIKQTKTRLLGFVRVTAQLTVHCVTHRAQFDLFDLGGNLELVVRVQFGVVFAGHPALLIEKNKKNLKVKMMSKKEGTGGGCE